MGDRLCVVMPVYNEEAAIGGVLVKWSSALSLLGIDYVIRPYNDGSKDASLKVMRDFAAANPNAHVEVRDKPNGGHGHTILTGYRDASADGFDWIFQIDSDDEMGPEKFGELWSRRRDYDFLAGIRDGRVQALPRKVISFVSRSCVRIFYGRKTIWDVNTPYRLMRVSALAQIFAQIPLSTFAPNVIISGMVARKRLRFYEMPVPQHDRTTGEVSIKKWKLLKAAARSFWQTVAFAFDAKRCQILLAVVMAVLACSWATAGFTDFGCSPVRRKFTNAKCFSDFHFTKCSQLAVDHYHPEGMPAHDAPYSAICQQMVMPFPKTTAGAARFMAISGLLYLMGIGLLARARKMPVPAAVLAAACTATFIHSLERGNPIIIAAAAVCVFVAWYDSETAWKRYVAASMLALAAVMKIGPAVLGAMYIPNILRPRTWRWREIGVTCVAGVILLVVPFFLFDYKGFSDIVAWLENARANGEHYRLMGNFGLPACFGWLNKACETWGHPLSFMGMAASRPVSAACGVLIVLSAFFARQRVPKMFLLAAGMVLIPGNSFFYCLLYIIPIALMAVNERPLLEGLLMFALMFLPIGFSLCGVSLWIPMVNCGVMGFAAWYAFHAVLAVRCRNC